MLRCPWHGWEFDILDGRSVFNPHRVRARSYEVLVESDPPGDLAAGHCRPRRPGPRRSRRSRWPSSSKWSSCTWDSRSRPGCPIQAGEPRLQRGMSHMEQGTTALAPRGMDLGQPVIDGDIHCNVPSARGAVSVPDRALARVHPHLGLQGAGRHAVSRRRADDRAAPGTAARGQPARLEPRAGPRAGARRLERRGRHPQLRLRRRRACTIPTPPPRWPRPSTTG